MKESIVNSGFKDVFRRNVMLFIGLIILLLSILASNYLSVEEWLLNRLLHILPIFILIGLWMTAIGITNSIWVVLNQRHNKRKADAQKKEKNEDLAVILLLIQAFANKLNMVKDSYAKTLENDFQTIASMEYLPFSKEVIRVVLTILYGYCFLNDDLIMATVIELAYDNVAGFQDISDGEHKRIGKFGKKDVHSSTNDEQDILESIVEGIESMKENMEMMQYLQGSSDLSEEKMKVSVKATTP